MENPVPQAPLTGKKNLMIAIPESPVSNGAYVQGSLELSQNEEAHSSPANQLSTPTVTTLKNVVVELSDENEVLRRELEIIERKLEDSEQQREVQQWHLRTEIDTVRHQLKLQIEKNFGLHKKLKSKDADINDLLLETAEVQLGSLPKNDPTYLDQAEELKVLASMCSARSEDCGPASDLYGMATVRDAENKLITPRRNDVGPGLGSQTHRRRKSQTSSSS